MSQDQFAALIPYITDDLASAIAQRQHIPDLEAITKLYHSKIYALLEKEETKLWQYSTDMLYHLLEQEEASGTLLFPDV